MTYLERLAERILEEREKLEREEREKLERRGLERCPKCNAIGEIGIDCKCNPFSQPVSLDDFEN